MNNITLLPSNIDTGNVSKRSKAKNAVCYKYLFMIHNLLTLVKRECLVMLMMLNELELNTQWQSQNIRAYVFSILLITFAQVAKRNINKIIR